MNYDGPWHGTVREFVPANVAYWIDEFHIDGMRIDDTQALFDTGHDHILGAIARRMREAAGHRRVLVLGESEPQHARLLRDPAAGEIGFDTIWSDDSHHATRVAVTGRHEGYYAKRMGWRPMARRNRSLPKSAPNIFRLMGLFPRRTTHSQHRIYMNNFT